MKSEFPQSRKKPYDVPKFSVYGDFREITKTVGATGGNDGGEQQGMNKMSP